MAGRWVAVGLVLLAVLGRGPVAWGGESHESHGGGTSHGAGIGELLELARTLNPEVAAMRLEADAAQAAVEGEGSLPDPKFRVGVEDMPRSYPSYFPSFRPNVTKYTFSQELPFFGKRGLKEEIAGAGASAARAAAQSTLNDVLTRVKVAYAEYHQAHMAMEQTSSLIDVLGSVAQVAQLRYGQGLGSQQDAAGAEVERSSMEAELARLKASRYKARARLNALVDRPAEALLVEEPHPRPLPPPSALDNAVLLDRARTGNPRFAEIDARIAGADRGKDLADRNWFPDVGVGVAAVQRTGDIVGYEAMIEMSVPLQWGLRRSQQDAAAAAAAAARSRKDAAARQIESELHEAFLSLQSARKVEQLLSESTLPQAEVAFQSAVKSYELGRAGLIDVLTALQRLRRAQIDQINAFYEQQTRLAEIERLVGGDL